LRRCEKAILHVAKVGFIVYFSLKHHHKARKKMQQMIVYIAMLMIFIGFFQSGCGSLSRQTDMMKQSENIDISSLELSNRLYIFNFRFAAIVENAADEIMQKTDDQTIRQNALSWKMNAIPASQEALFRMDPMAALIEISTFSIQMELFFTGESGHELFGPWQSIAINATKSIQDELRELWKKASKSGELKHTAQGPIYQWAKSNPIENLTFSNRSISDTLVSFYSNIDIGLQESVGGIALGIYDIRERLTYYTAMLPRQARWQAEYLINEKLQGDEIDKALDNLTRITNMIEKSPEMINDLQTSTLAELSKERVAVLIAIEQERLAVLQEINRQRQQTIADLETIMGNLSAQIMAQTTVSAQTVIDHFFWRLAQVLLVGGVLVVAVIVLFRFLPAPRHRRP
jgi:hypothetical protein